MPDAQQVDQLIRDGVEAIHGGDRDAGRVALARALALDQENVTAWLWLGVAVDTPEQAAFCFEKALVLDPDNDYARLRLADVADEFPVLPALLPLPPEPGEGEEGEADAALPFVEPSFAESDPDDRSELSDVGLASSTEWGGELDWSGVDSWGETADWKPTGEPVTPPETAAPSPEEPAPLEEPMAAPAEPVPTPEEFAPAPAEPAPEEPTLHPEPVTDESWRDALFAEAEPAAEAAPDAEADAGAAAEEDAAAEPPAEGEEPAADAPAADEVAAGLDAEPTPDILDLVDGWGNAVILHVEGAYRQIVDATLTGQTALSYFFAALLTTISTFLFIRMVILPFGIQPLLNQLSTTAPEFDTALLGVWLSRLGLVAPLAALSMVVGRLVYGGVMHFIASLFRGEGTAGRTLSAVGLSTVSQSVLTVVVVFLLVVLGLGVGGGVAITLSTWLNLLVGIYTLVADVIAIRTAHSSLSTGAAIGSVVMTSLILSSLLCCLVFIVGALGAA